MSQSNYENNEDFEKYFAEFIGRKHVVSVASATDALHFTLQAYGISANNEVLVTDFSWISSSACVNMVGAIPVFCDIDIKTYHIDIDSVRRMITPNTKAIVYPHLFGSMTDTSELQKLCKDNNIIFIEDSAQSLGSSLNGQNAGTIGDASVFSFNSNKVIAGVNGGGVVMTDDEELAKRVKMIRRHGKDKDFSTLGYNSRMYVLNGKIIKQRLKFYKENQIRRQEIAKMYDEAFADLPIILQSNGNGLNHNYHKYVIRLQDKETRKNLKNALKASIHYETPLSKNSMYNTMNMRKDDCVNSKIASDTVLSLSYTCLAYSEEVISIINTVKESRMADNPPNT